MSNPRNTIRFMLLFLLLLGVAPFFVPGPDGRPIVSWEKFKQRILASLPDVPVDTGTVATTPAPDRKQKVYRWKDAKAVWHFTHETPPREAREISIVDDQVNIIPARKSPASAAVGGPTTADGKNMPALPYSLDGVRQVLDEARKARDGGNRYNQNLEQAVDNM